MASPRDADQLLACLRVRLKAEGLNVVLPLSVADFDRVTRPTGPSAGELLRGAGGAILLGDGGPGFFEAFQSASAGPRSSTARDPLDVFTRQVVGAAVTQAMDPWQPARAPSIWRVIYPFIDAQPALPFQRLGEAAGLPAPGPLGIQIHPDYGPWWAYRALVLVALPLATAPLVEDSCLRCARPCELACPGAAVFEQGFVYQACGDHRLGRGRAVCATSCAARAACPVGSEHRYSDRQLAFHMRASMPIGDP